ncbi:mothers against decapentaplegic homolog 6 [Eurytemora carolleeae]|uniref:mothers against decapentaplegic homolog 6 n=1 Tax=Eurytemora carolleeae TaxID=1294199 RepID=UPI000C77D5F1|nr:mothers against decapentaplegic homolog 6 [Eurytemora carolleeae]|eukprot:XP_023335058.1 mothers against decapentaplegic homolog 6-like [Eurytemora affinis]
MYIFRNKRSELVRKIWRESRHHDDLSPELKSQLSSVLKRVREPVLVDLLAVLQKRGQYFGGCCPVPNQKLGRHPVVPLVLMCRIWRWKDVEGEQLVRLPICQFTPDNLLECCNPYHWARRANPDEFLSSNPAKGISYCDNQYSFNLGEIPLRVHVFVFSCVCVHVVMCSCVRVLVFSCTL